jgi:hypothetical protein
MLRSARLAVGLRQVYGRAKNREVVDDHILSIEQDFHDLKEVEGLGQQQVRNIWTNVGAFHISAWVHTLVELWAWGQPKETLCDRSASPWDDAERRPSHADRRKALQRQCLGREFQRLAEGQALTPEIQQFIGRVINHAA